MTRKRYCKLMIAKGLSRNAANASADRVREVGSYDKLWISNCFTAKALVDAFNAVVKNLLERMADSLRSINV